MITTEPLELISLVVMKDKAEELSSHLLHTGSFHPVDIRTVEPGLEQLSLMEISRDFERFDRLQSRSAEIAGKMAVKLAPRRDIQEISYESADGVLAELCGKVDALVAKRQELANALRSDELILSQVKGVTPLALRPQAGFSLLNISIGSLEEKNLPILERGLGQLPHVLFAISKTGTRINLLFLGLRRDRVLTNEVFSDVGWQEEDPSKVALLSEDAQKKLKEGIASRREAIYALDRDMKELSSANADELARVYSFSAFNKSLLEAKRYAARTGMTVIFSGWVPRRERDRLINGARSLTQISYVEAVPPEATAVAREDIPVRVSRNRLLKPFGLLVDSYGIPRYGTIDPALFVALGFVFMFGLMFGDLGQGLIFALGGAAVLVKSRSILARQFAALLCWCGSSAAVFGLLEGSVFGVEFHSAFKPPLENVEGMLSLSVYAGITIITAGIVINCINAARDRDRARLLFDKSGLIPGLVYWTAVAVIIRQMFERAPVPAALYWIIAAGSAAMFVFPLAEYFAHRKKKHGGSFTESFMESLLGLLEFGMGYLANTVSFVRMGAFALAHAALLLSVFEISHMTKGAGSLVVVIGGNLGVMILEGVVVSIQSLRLNYYEFFSKFFIPGKTVFKPLSV